MAGVITSIPPLVEQPPGSNSSNPAGLPGVTYTAAIPTLPQTWTALQTYTLNSIQFAGSTSGNTLLNATAIASGTLTLPAATDTLVGRNTTDTLTNKTLTSPIFVTPNLGVATATSINKYTFTTPATAATLTILDGKTATFNNSISFAGADATTMTFPTTSGAVSTADNTATLTNKTFDTAGAGNSLSIAGAAVTANTGTGAVVRATSPTLVTPALGTPASGVATNLTGTASGLTAGNVTTNANLTGDVTSAGNATTLTNAPVIAKVLTGYVSGAGTVAATDSILQAIQKLNGNDATNANLTGPITSVGNATSIASQTGTGTKFVVDTSPTLVTPNLGTPSAVVLTNGTGLPLSGHTTQAAYTFVGNNTGSAAVPTAVDIAALTTKASPVATDLVMISDQAAAGAWKKVTISSLASAGSVASIAGNTGAFTLNSASGITNSTNDIILSQGSSAQFGAVKVDNTSISAASGVITSVSASKAQQQTGTDNNVNVKPAHQQDHDSAAKAWVMFTGSGSNGAQTVNASYNVTSVTRTAAGQYTITFTTAFASASYACNVNMNNTALNAVGCPTTLAAGSAAIQFVQLSPIALVDPANGAYASFFGRQ